MYSSYSHLQQVVMHMLSLNIGIEAIVFVYKSSSYKLACNKDVARFCHLFQRQKPAIFFTES